MEKQLVYRQVKKTTTKKIPAALNSIEQDPLSSVQNVYKHIGFVGPNEIDISMVKTEKMRDAISESREQRFREENSMHQ